MGLWSTFRPWLVYFGLGLVYFGFWLVYFGFGLVYFFFVRPGLVYFGFGLVYFTLASGRSTFRPGLGIEVKSKCIPSEIEEVEVK